MNIITNNLDEKAPVYFQYSIQNHPQPAYIELDCRGDGELMADYSGEIGNAVPMYYWHNLAVRWGIPCEASGDSLRNLFEDEEFLAICQRILDGFEEVWDGSNYVGRYTADAQDAIEEAEKFIEQSLSLCEVWDVEDWLFSNCSLKEHWSDEPVEDAAATCESYIESNQVIDGDIEEALVHQAQTLFTFEQWNKLTKTHVDELLKRELISQQDYAEWVEDQS